MIIFSLLLLSAAVAPQAAPPPVVQVLAASTETPDTPYLAFPAVLDLGSEVLISFKRGRSHAADPGAVLDVLRLDRISGKALSRGTLAGLDGKIMQMGEWVRFADGRIASFIDAQQKEVPTRVGLQAVYSTDGGRSFTPVQRVGVIDGVEYGYAFDAITEGSTTWMLVMTFANFTGGKQIWKTKSQPGSVDIIRTEDNGASWRFVRSLTQELGGAPINESCFVRHDDGFLIAARGYDQRQWLSRTDAQLKVVQKIDLASAHSFFHRHIGRPRIFIREGACYLLARTFADPRASHMRLTLSKIDPATLAITRHVILDNAGDSNVTDGYYAEPYWSDDPRGSRFHVITYKRIGDGNPDIIDLEFAWEDVK